MPEQDPSKKGETPEIKIELDKFGNPYGLFVDDLGSFCIVTELPSEAGSTEKSLGLGKRRLAGVMVLSREQASVIAVLMQRYADTGSLQVSPPEPDEK